MFGRDDSAYIAHLKEENARLWERLDLERRRAEMAIDELLRRTGVATPLAQAIPVPPDEREAERKFREMVTQPEFTDPAI